MDLSTKPNWKKSPNTFELLEKVVPKVNPLTDQKAGAAKATGIAAKATGAEAVLTAGIITDLTAAITEDMAIIADLTQVITEGIAIITDLTAAITEALIIAVITEAADTVIIAEDRMASLTGDAATVAKNMVAKDTDPIITGAVAWATTKRDPAHTTPATRDTATVKRATVKGATARTDPLTKVMAHLAKAMARAADRRVRKLSLNEQ